MGTAHDGFVEVIDTRTDKVQMVPRDWLDNPVLGRFIERTLGQRAIDGELGAAPSDESSMADIRQFASDAGIDVSGLRSKEDLLGAIRAVVGTDPLPVDVTPGDVDVQNPGAASEPLTGGSLTSPGGTEPSTNPPATGDKE